MRTGFLGRWRDSIHIWRLRSKARGEYIALCYITNQAPCGLDMLAAISYDFCSRAYTTAKAFDALRKKDTSFTPTPDWILRAAGYITADTKGRLFWKVTQNVDCFGDSFEQSVNAIADSQQYHGW